eukprot:PITA_21811
MNKKKPTWDNKGTGEAALWRRLDQFLIQEDLLPIFSIFRQWLPFDQGSLANTHASLSQLGVSHFKQLFKALSCVSLPDIIWTAGLFPNFVEPDHLEDLINPVSLGEMESTLKWFKRDRGPRLDSWPVDFYLTFFDILGPDLLVVVEECQTGGRLHDPINSTFIALIPKLDSPLSFNDFHPISLCNYLYKIISKIIANQIKPILSEHISPEKFAFLQNRQIHEATCSVQEVIHSIKLKNLKKMTLKINLSKAFDKVS